MLSTRLTSPWRRSRAAARLEHGVNELEDAALIGGRQLLDAAEAFQEPRGLRGEHRAHRFHAEQLVGRDAPALANSASMASGGLGYVGGSSHCQRSLQRPDFFRKATLHRGRLAEETSQLRVQRRTPERDAAATAPHSDLRGGRA